MKESRIAILMSTYNGSKFIAAQINSIINQDLKYWDLYIRDDGSQDSTIEIIKQYMMDHKNIHLINDSVTHRGIRDSYLYLLSKVDSEYYMFCDQDDIWLPSKISICLNEIKKKTNIESLPLLICCDLEIVDKDLNQVYPSLWKKCNIVNYIKDVNNSIIIAPLFQGCTMLFNKAARNVALHTPPHPHAIHDIHLSLSIAKVRGKIIPLNEVLIKYRQHTDNVVGASIATHSKLRKILYLKDTLYNLSLQYSFSHHYLNTNMLIYIYKKIIKIIHSGN